MNGVTLLADNCPSYWEAANGGRHRTQQLHELLMDSGAAIEVLRQAPEGAAVRKYLSGLSFMARNGFRHSLSLRALRHYGSTVLRMGTRTIPHDGFRVLVWENTHRNNVALPTLAQSAGFAVLAVPQNLEALWETRSARNLRSKTDAFADELTGLRQADAVFCISREEQWLLRNFGIAADFLPYFPPHAVHHRMSTVRERRSGARGNFFLILGSAGNPPTRAGMITLIGILRALPGGDRISLHIAGYGTESLRAEVAGMKCHLHGGVDQAKLEELLATTRAALIHQNSATGALTRIPELIVAGIPIIANPIAARSATHYDGVHTYQAPESLLELLQQALPQPAIPNRPVDAERRFLNAVTTLAADQPWIGAI